MLKIGAIVKVHSATSPFMHYNGRGGKIIKEGKDYNNVLLFTVRLEERNTTLLLYSNELSEVNE